MVAPRNNNVSGVRLSFWRVAWLALALLLVAQLDVARADDDDDDNVVGEIVVNILVGLVVGICAESETGRAIMAWGLLLAIGGALLQAAATEMFGSSSRPPRTWRPPRAKRERSFLQNAAGVGVGYLAGRRVGRSLFSSEH